MPPSPSRLRSALAFATFLASSAPVGRARADEPKPFRAAEALGVPSTIKIGLDSRWRYERLDDDFRTARRTNDVRALSIRTLLSAEATFGAFVIGGELQDARVYATSGAPLTAQFVDVIEPLQAYVGVRVGNVRARAGRMTVDVGSRRLVSRNDFRNTLNGFTGVDVDWTRNGSKDEAMLRAFAFMPVTRLPTDLSAVEHNRTGLDHEDTKALLLGAFARSPRFERQAQLEAYVLVLRESDTKDAPSNDRRLVTPGLRFLLPPRAGAFDVQIESMLQLGTSRASNAEKDTTDLTHLASSMHAEVGASPKLGWKPRVAFLFDHATGDRSPRDGKNQRFDPMFGTSNLDFGPTGFYGALVRSNVLTPGLRFDTNPHARVDTSVSYRPVWLASSRDAWTSAAQRDATGKSGSFVGQQMEGRVRLHVIPRNVVLDLGGAVLLRGRFAKDAPKGRDEATKFGYAAVTGTI